MTASGPYAFRQVSGSIWAGGCSDDETQGSDAVFCSDDTPAFAFLADAIRADV